MPTPINFIRHAPAPFDSDADPNKVTAFEHHRKALLESAAMAAGAFMGSRALSVAGSNFKCLPVNPTTRKLLEVAILAGTVAAPIAAYAMNDDPDKQKAYAGLGIAGGIGALALLAHKQGAPRMVALRDSGSRVLSGVYAAYSTDALRQAHGAYSTYKSRNEIG